MEPPRRGSAGLKRLFQTITTVLPSSRTGISPGGRWVREMERSSLDPHPVPRKLKSTKCEQARNKIYHKLR